MKYPLEILTKTNIQLILLDDKNFTDLIINHFKKKVYTSEYDAEKDDLITRDVSSQEFSGQWYIKMLFSKDTEIEK